ALLALARAAAAAGDAGPLREGLARLALPRRPESARGMADDIVKRADGRLDLVANALPAGADAPSLLRALGSSLVGREAVGLELVDAALLLDPERPDVHVTRALLAVHLGRPEVALAEAALLPAEHAEQRAFLEAYTRVIFCAYPFAPAGLEIRTAFPDVPEGPEQPLAKVRAQLMKYATRLGLCRAAVLARLPPGATPAWLPPDLSSLLPDGPVALETWEFEEIVQDENDEGEAAEDEAGAAPTGAPAPEPEARLVTVDETLPLDASASLPALLRQARREWAGLCWMCWGVGLDRVALPERVDAPADFGQAAGLSLERLWRCRDRVVTGGLRAMTQGVPGFRWEGLEIDVLPVVLAEIAADEYREMRAVFYWLCDEGVQSPWQDNVRTPD
ncbi:MAG TPA: thiol reductase thioredoxin, partial [Polyangia bacterium]|nr:thiol reductase thioredoxin [Polyangia bacterium]